MLVVLCKSTPLGSHDTLKVEQNYLYATPSQKRNFRVATYDFGSEFEPEQKIHVVQPLTETHFR